MLDKGCLLKECLEKKNREEQDFIEKFENENKHLIQEWENEIKKAIENNETETSIIIELGDTAISFYYFVNEIGRYCELKGFGAEPLSTLAFINQAPYITRYMICW